MADSGYSVNMNAQNLLKMVCLLLGFLGSWFRSQKDLAVENVALRQQLSAFKHKQPRLALTTIDRALVRTAIHGRNHARSTFGEPQGHPKAAQLMAGHKSLTVTMKYYTRLKDGFMRETMRKYEEYKRSGQQSGPGKVILRKKSAE